MAKLKRLIAEKDRFLSELTGAGGDGGIAGGVGGKSVYS